MRNMQKIDSMHRTSHRSTTLSIAKRRLTSNVRCEVISAQVFANKVSVFSLFLALSNDVFSFLLRVEMAKCEVRKTHVVQLNSASLDREASADFERSL